MRYLTEGIAAYQARQYTEALEYFRRSLPGVRVASERERVLMWIACSGLAVGNRTVLLDACSQLLGSADGEIRRFARFGLRQYGLEHPGTSARALGQPRGMVENAVRLYFAQFWSLVRPVWEVMAWMVGLGLVALGWTACVLARVPLESAGNFLGIAQAVWLGTLLVVPLGACALLVLDRLLRAVRSQWQTVQGALGIIATSPVHPLALALGILVMSAVVGVCAQLHWGAAVVVALFLEPWCLCLYASAQFGRTWLLLADCNHRDPDLQSRA